MFFDNLEQIRELAVRHGTSIFVVPDTEKIQIPGAIVLRPDEKTTITIEQVRDVFQRIELKQIDEQIIMIRPADKLGLEAANALLKNLEEPGDKVHFALISQAPSKLLPTILSRANVYFWKGAAFDLQIRADDKKKAVAKKLLVARPAEIIAIAEEITKKKNGAREYALEILGITIEMLYKSYFMTGKDVFVKKLPGFLSAYENILRNGHVKLHLIADLI